VTRNGLIGLIVAGCWALATAAGASASTLEYGFCTPVKGGTGSYGTATCTALGGRLNHVWSALTPPESIPVAVEKWPNTASISVVFEQGTLICKHQNRTEGAENGEGEIHGLSLEFTECYGFFAQHGEGVCSSPGEPPGTVATAPLYAVAGVIKTGETPLKDMVGLDFTPETGETFLEATCGPVSVVATGSVIVTAGKNKMLTKQKLRFIAKPPENFVGGPPQILHGFINGKPLGRARFEMGEGLFTARALELRDCMPGC
jgi:hypothetical protein